jgi:hypothetical protein
VLVNPFGPVVRDHHFWAGSKEGKFEDVVGTDVIDGAEGRVIIGYLFKVTEVVVVVFEYTRSSRYSDSI